MFKITIEEITATNEPRQKWEIISRENGRDSYGYTPMTDARIERKIDVYTQQVETIDLVAVINAVNGK